MITIPKLFIDTAVDRNGEDGRKWISALPDLIQFLCREWELEVDGRPMHGYLGLVIPVRRQDELYALKISWLNEDTIHEAAALALWNGNGAVQLIESRPESGAMLLERLDFNRTLEDTDIIDAVAISGRLLRRLAVQTTGPFHRLEGIAEQAAGNMQKRWQQLARPFSKQILEKAVYLVGHLGSTVGDLLVNYDIHYENVLAGKREPWLAVDPKTVIGDPEYGIAQLLWTRLEDILANGGLDYHFDLLVESAELDAQLAREWSLVRCVDYWLWGLGVGLTEDPPRCEYVVNWLLASRR